MDLHGRSSRIGEYSVDALTLQGLDQDVAPFSGLAIEAVHPVYMLRHLLSDVGEMWHRCG